MNTAIEFFKVNGWILSLFAIVISVLALSLNVIDKFKAWAEQKKIVRLKKDKSVLFSIADLKVDAFYSVEVTKTIGFKNELYLPHYSRLYGIIQNIRIELITDKTIKSQIAIVKNVPADDLFRIRNFNDSYSVEFSQDLNALIAETRKYLAEVL